MSGVDHPVSLNKHKKELLYNLERMLSPILALKHFEDYLTSSSPSTVVFKDPNPLIFAACRD